METFQALLPYWPLLFWAVITSVIAQTLKKQVLTIEDARKVKVIYWLRRALPILLLVLGAGVGLVWPSDAIPNVVTKAQRALAFAGAAGASLVWFNVFSQWVKTKLDVHGPTE